LFTLNGTD